MKKILLLLLSLTFASSIFAMEDPKDNQAYSRNSSKNENELVKQLKAFFLKLDTIIQDSPTLEEAINNVIKLIEDLYLLNDFFKLKKNDLFKHCQKSLKNKFAPFQQLSESELLNKIYKGEIEAFYNFILLGFNVNQSTIFDLDHSNVNQPLIFEAIKFRNVALINLLIIFEVRLDCVSQETYESVGHICRQTGEHVSNIDKIRFETPLIYSVRQRQKEIANALIIHGGAYINGQNVASQTALYVATKYCDLEIVDLLIQNNASPLIRDINNSIPLDIAKKNLGCCQPSEYRYYDYLDIKNKIEEYTLNSLIKLQDFKGCQDCGKKPSENKKFQRCSRCRKVSYCSIECQTKNWPQHKLICKKN